MSRSHTPKDEQRTKATTIVAMGTDLSTAGLASVDVLFTDDEMARCKTSVTKGFHQLDNGKLGRSCPFYKEGLTRHFLVSNGIT